VSRVRLRATAATVACCLAAACGGGHAAPLPAPTRSFPLALAEAQVAAADGRYADAERVLGTFGRTFGGTREAAEALYWRALFRLDPANRDASAREAITLFDAYLRSPTAIEHRADAATLRRLAAQRETMGRELEIARAEAARPVVSPPPAPVVRDTVEIQKLRDSLARTNAELDRIKRRIGGRRP
jgi:hypothetical protein